LLLYYITDRSQFSGDEVSRRRKLLDKVAEAAECCVDFIQLREKDISIRELELLAKNAMKVIRENSAGKIGRTRLLINSRTDVAIACGADGVHLRSDDVSPGTVREMWENSLRPVRPKALISVACHTVNEVALAARGGADFALFGPVFEKRKVESRSGLVDVRAHGVHVLKEACREGVPVIALGGVAFENASACIDAGAAGIAGIRIFQQNQIGQVVRQFRG
jgi:thiamine-phosphate pyrophosphorylase